MSPEKLPDDLDKPHPMEPGGTADALIGLAGLLLIPVGVAMFFSLGVIPRRTAGATRSSQLIWQQRQAEIQHAVTTANAAAPTEQAPSPADPAPPKPEP